MFLIVALSTIMFSCKKDNPSPETSLEVDLVDNLGNPISGASVKLYYTNTDWNNDTNQIGQTQTSDLTWKVVFPNLSAIKYFWFAEKDCENNVYGAATTSNPLTGGIKNTVTSVLSGTGTLVFGNNSKNPYHVYLNGTLAFDLNGGSTMTYRYQQLGSYTIRVLQISGYVVTPTDITYTGTLNCGGTLTTTFPSSN